MVDVELLPIGAAAARLGLNPSALRYYDEHGLVRPAARAGGRRMYGPAELRRLAFIQLAQRLGIRLDAAAAVLDEPGERWRAIVGEQIDALDQLITLAEAAKDFLSHALQCPAEHPVTECPVMIESLDRRVAGDTIEQIAAEHGYPAAAHPGRRTHRPPRPPPTATATPPTATPQ